MNTSVNGNRKKREYINDKKTYLSENIFELTKIELLLYKYLYSYNHRLALVQRSDFSSTVIIKKINKYCTCHSVLHYTRKHVLITCTGQDYERVQHRFVKLKVMNEKLTSAKFCYLNCCK